MLPILVENISEEDIAAEISAYVGSMAETAFEDSDYGATGLSKEDYCKSVNKITIGQLRNLRTPYLEWRNRAGPPERLRLKRIRIMALAFFSAFLAIAANLVLRQLAEVALLKHVLSVVAAHLDLFNAGLLIPISVVWIAVMARETPWQPMPKTDSVSEPLNNLIQSLILQPATSALQEVKWTDSITDEVRIQDGEYFTTKADSKNIYNTPAYNRAAIALARRHGTAIGVAGSRGCGKTELARTFTELRQSDSQNQISILMWAPAECNADIFILRLLKELCIRILDSGSASPGRRSYAELGVTRFRQWILAMFVATALIGLGSALLFYDLTDRDIRDIWPVASSALLMWAGIGISLFALASTPLRSSRTGIKRSTLDLAAELLSRADFTETIKTTSQIGISTHGFSALGMHGTELARLPLSEIDVVREMRALVEALSSHGQQVVIAIDELDKMPDEQAAIEFLNHIKVLFPIAGCSFIVSVSERAWSQFEYRGLPFRDAFDSSFDEIIHIDALRAAESRELLKRRHKAVTDPEALLCHCLSGGLPRDLMRWIRALARISATINPANVLGAPRLNEVLEVLLLEEVTSKELIGARGRSKREWLTSLWETNGTLMTWSGIWPDSIATEERLIKALAQASYEDFTESDGRFEAEFEIYMSILHTIRQAFGPSGPLSQLVDEVGYESSMINGGFELIAQARYQLSLSSDRSLYNLCCARKGLGLGPLLTMRPNSEDSRLPESDS